MQMDMNLHLVNPWAHRLLHLPRFVGSVVAVTESRVWRLIGCYIRTCMIQNMSVSWLVDVSFSLFFLWTLSVSLLAAILCVPCCFPLLCALSLFSQLLLIPPALHYCPLLFSITRCCSRLNSFVPCCFPLFPGAFYCPFLFSIAPCCSILPSTALYCPILFFFVPCFSSFLVVPYYPLVFFFVLSCFPLFPVVLYCPLLVFLIRFCPYWFLLTHRAYTTPMTYGITTWHYNGMLPFPCSWWSLNIYAAISSVKFLPIVSCGFDQRIRRPVIMKNAVVWSREGQSKLLPSCIAFCGSKDAWHLKSKTFFFTTLNVRSMMDSALEWHFLNNSAGVRGRYLELPHFFKWYLTHV